MTASRYTLVHRRRGEGKPPDPRLASDPQSSARSSAIASGSVPRPQRVGVWDLGAWLSGLERLVRQLTEAQLAFDFFEVKAAVPAGLISRPERMVAWLKERMPHATPALESQIQDNLIAEDFYPIGEDVARDLGIDYIVGVTPSMVAFEDEDGANANYFSTFEGHAILASTYGLRTYARETNLTLERYLGLIVVSSLLAARSWPTLGFHPNTDCLFDFDAERVTIKVKALRPAIEASCMDKIREEDKAAAKALVSKLSEI